MTIPTVSAAVLGVAALLAPASAQETKPKPGQQKAVPVKALRLTAAGGQRQPPSQEELAALLAKKREGAWLQNAEWVMDLDQARERAKQGGKQIFAYFTRSYAP